MKYMYLLFDSDQAMAALSKEAFGALMEEHKAYAGTLAKAGVMVAGDPLTPASTATTLRLQGGKVLKTDGPYAETKEQLGGYYVVNVKDLDEALAWAAKCPSTRTGAVEVRPIADIE